MCWSALPPGLTLELMSRTYDDRFAADLHRLAVGKADRFWGDCDDADIIRS